MSNSDPIRIAQGEEKDLSASPDEVVTVPEALRERCLSNEEIDLVPGGMYHEVKAENLNCHWNLF
jgi:hypothetical protein